MGYIANAGMMFTESYGEQSCSAGRSSFITGQSVYRIDFAVCGCVPLGNKRAALANGRPTDADHLISHLPPIAANSLDVLATNFAAADASTFDKFPRRSVVTAR